MINNDYTSAAGIIIVAVHANCECNLAMLKRGMDLSLLFLHRQGLAGRPRYAGPPDLPFAGLQSALGSLPSVALSSPLEQMGLLPRAQVSSRGVFPVSVSLGAYRRGKGNGCCLEG